MGKEDSKDELLCCINFPGRTTGSAICQSTVYFGEKKIDWENVFKKKLAVWNSFVHLCRKKLQRCFRLNSFFHKCWFHC